MPPGKPTKEFHPLAGIIWLPFIVAPCVFLGGASGVVSPGLALGERLVVGLGLVLYVALLVWFLYLNAYLDEPLKASHAVNLEAWETSLSRWRELYYCSRDDCLFIPGEGAHFNVSELKEAIKWQPPKKRYHYLIKPFWEWT
jgi:hypothetical protein